MMKKIIIMQVFICLSGLLQAQQSKKPAVVYTDALSLKLIGQAFPVKNSFHRVDTAAWPNLPAKVKMLLTQGAGLAISFKTNSPRITAKWCVTDSKPAPTLNSIANKGLDLYIKRNGRWEYAGIARPKSVCSEYVMVQDMDKSEKECLLYLSLYDEVKSLSVGIDSGYRIAPGEDPFTKRVLVYGSSIVQGAAAGRPGMAYPARLSRATGIHFLNLGMSGSAKMEKPVADMVAAVEADAFVLDCIPNSTPEEVTERTAYLVKTIRTKHPDAPIIIIQSIFRENGNFNRSVREKVHRQNENVRKEYQKLIHEGIKDLYFIPADHLMGEDHEASTDGTHPNDMGFDRMLEVIKPEVLRILQK